MIERWIHEIPTSVPLANHYEDRPFANAYLGAPERLPAPIGINCDQHPSWPLVWAMHKGQPDMGWCRRGQHLVCLSNAQGS